MKRKSRRGEGGVVGGFVVGRRLAGKSSNCNVWRLWEQPGENKQDARLACGLCTYLTIVTRQSTDKAAAQKK